MLVKDHRRRARKALSKKGSSGKAKKKAAQQVRDTAAEPNVLAILAQQKKAKRHAKQTNGMQAVLLFLCVFLLLLGTSMLRSRRCISRSCAARSCCTC